MKHKKTVIFLSLLTLVTVIILITNIFSSGSTPAETKIFLKENDPQVITFYTTYNLCGHKTVYTTRSDRYFPSAVDAESYNPDFSVDEFSAEKITLSKTENKYCNAHFYAVLNENMIYIYSRYSGKAEYGFPAISSRLTEDEINSLKNGVDFDSRESMLSFVEDYTS